MVDVSPWGANGTEVEGNTLIPFASGAFPQGGYTTMTITFSPPGGFGLRFAEPGTRRGSLDHRIQLYDGEIAYVDEQVGVLLADLSARGLEESTLVEIHGEDYREYRRRVGALVPFPGKR